MDHLALDPLLHSASRVLMEGAVAQFYAFTLVVIRMSGLMTIGPLFGQSVVPGNIRVMIVITLSLLVTPTLFRQQDAGFHRLDADGNGRLTANEVPEQLQERLEDKLHLAAAGEGTPANDGMVTLAEYRTAPRMPSSVADYVWIGVGEFALGLVLGLGVLTILSGLQLAGEIIDQQSGVALAELASPGLEISGSTTGRFLFIFGMTVLLLTGPLSGHLQMVGALIETFQTLPVGEAVVTKPVFELLRDLVHESLVLGVQAAAPTLAVMSLVALAMGYLGHSVQQIQVLALGFPVRGMVCFLVLALSLSGIARQVVDTVPAVIDALRQSLTGLV